MRFFVRSSVLLAIALSPVLASAQGTPGTSAPAGSSTAPVPPGGGTSGGGAAPAATDDKKQPGREAAGYAYDDKRPAQTTARRALIRHKSGPIVNLPGFEQLPDGGSRLFVQLSQNVPVEERKAQGSITYILKGAHARVHNNTNALVTVHFNTPVSRARLVPHGNDLHFIVELRSAVAPTWKMVDAQDKTSMLTVDFAKGDFGGGDDAKLPAPAATKPVKGVKKGQKPAAGAEEPAPQPGPNP